MDMEVSSTMKERKCSSLSGRSTLTYHVGCSDKNSITFRIVGNTGRGLYCKEWITFDQIEEALRKEWKPFTAVALESLYKGKSSNSAGFLLAVLKNEGLVTESEEKRNSYRFCGPSGFRSSVNELIQAQAGQLVSCNEEGE